MTHGEETVDFDNRELCPDGGCTGVIGSDGKCKECGRAGSGRKSAKAAARDAGDDADHDEDRDDDDDGGADPDKAVAAAVSEGSGEEAPADFADRALCPDGACIGVLGDDGKCKVCGQSVT